MFTGYVIGFSIGIAGMALVTCIHINHEKELLAEIEKLRMRRIRIAPEPIFHCTTCRKVKGVIVAEHPEEGAELWTDF